MSNLILFDIDNTLLDTKKLANDLVKPALSQHFGADHQDFLQTSDAYWQTLADPTDFNPEEYAAFLMATYGGDAQELLSIIFAPELYRQSLFPDVEPLLQQLSATYQFGIFSQGNEIYQRQKLELAGLTHWFKSEQIFLLRRKMEPAVLKELPESVVVDDKLAVAETLSDYAQLLPVWLNRIDDTQIPGIATIHALSDLSIFL